MAIFEKRYQFAPKLDDTTTLTCTIETAQEIKGHTEYLLRVQRGTDKENCWKILRRYNDFVQLQKCLQISGIELPLPPKKLFGNMRPDFIAERRQALQLYINTVLMNPILASSLPAKRFVDPDSYSQSFHDQAVQNAVLCLRAENLWSLGSTMGPIGWRLRKHFFKVTSKPPEKGSGKLLVKSGSQSHQSKHSSAASSNSGSVGSGSSSSSHANGSGTATDSGHHIESNELVLEWLEYGPDKYIEDKEIGIILKSLMSLQHPNIEPIVYATHNENGCLVVRKFYKHGTLKDQLCMATPKNPFLSKYGNPKGRTMLTMKQVATYGRQILEALIFLHSKGYPYGHLHSGNIVIHEERVKLLDIENFVLGVPAFYRPFFVQHSKIHTIETVDVYAFGHVLFEMSMGYPMQESVVRQINECPEALKNLLESILSKEACKAGLPTLEQLINHQFFTQHATIFSSDVSGVEAGSKYHFKLPLNTKEIIKQASLKTEQRLRDEQKSVKNQKRIVRVQEMMSSEEEKRKTKQKAKHEQKQSKLKQQSSLQTNHGRLSLSTTTNNNASSSGSSNMPPLNRADSAFTVNLAHEASSGYPPLTPTDLKSPPPILSPHEHQQQQDKHHSSQIHQQAVGSPSTFTTSLANVERQSSSPNITTEETTDEPTRSALLESICKFNRGSLRKVRSND